MNNAKSGKLVFHLRNWVVMMLETVLVVVFLMIGGVTMLAGVTASSRYIDRKLRVEDVTIDSSQPVVLKGSPQEYADKNVRDGGDKNGPVTEYVAIRSSGGEKRSG